MTFFSNALPVWLKGRHTEKNCRAVFRTVADLTEGAVLRAASSGVYNIYIDGEFLAYGPARAGRNHFRVDEIDLSAFAGRERAIVLEVASYQVNSFCLMKQPPFLQTEMVSGGKAVAWTGAHFEAGIDTALVRHLQRFAFQRPFVEGYRLTPESYAYRREAAVPLTETVEPVDARILIPRDLDYPLYETVPATEIGGGTAVYSPCETYRDDRGYTDIGPLLGGFLPEQLEWHVYRELQDYNFSRTDQPMSTLTDGCWRLYEFPVNLAGFLRFSVRAAQPTVLYAIFDEMLVDGDLPIVRDGCCRAVKYELAPGAYDLKFFETYGMKFVKLFVAKGECEITDLRLTTYFHPPVKYAFDPDDDRVAAIERAAVNTFRANAVDLFTDCPSRERGGYLCDSFFTGRAEYLFTGGNRVEKQFLENFLHEEQYECIDPGIVPMCYPADHYDGVYIPNWGLWLILELREYLERTGDRDLIDRYRDKVTGILDFHHRLENEEGLMVHIPEGVFVEWSHANEMVQDINFPSNMLYTAALRAADALYGQPGWVARAARTREAVRKYAYSGGFFRDHAKVVDGRICTVEESSEVCQYYAFLTGIADRTTEPDLFNRMVAEFAPVRRETNPYPDICFANLFIGIPLRMELLLREGLFEQAKEEILHYYYPQAEKTGTLWEVLGYASCNHGFSSVAAYWLYEIRRHRTAQVLEYRGGFSI